MHNIYVPEAIAGVASPLLIAPLSEGGSRLFQTIPAEAYQGVFERVTDPSQADFIFAPHEYHDLKKHPELLQTCRTLAQVHHKPLIVSAYQDDPSPIDELDLIILRPSAYKSQLRANEHMMPGYVEDIGSARGVTYLPKGERPSVGFAGKAGFASAKERIRYLIRNYVVRSGPDRQGVYYRRKALKALARDARIDLREIVRKNFSANRKTVEVTPEQARTEYIENIQHTLATLSPRGDGNFSFRFFEVLSCGRIPVLIDTDMPLPLEDRIAYDEFIIRVPWNETHKVAEYVWNFFNSRSDDEVRQAQEKAREAFVTYLYMPRFFSTFFGDLT